MTNNKNQELLENLSSMIRVSSSSDAEIEWSEKRENLVAATIISRCGTYVGVYPNLYTVATHEDIAGNIPVAMVYDIPSGTFLYSIYVPPKDVFSMKEDVVVGAPIPEIPIGWSRLNDKILSILKQHMK